MCSEQWQGYSQLRIIALQYLVHFEASMPEHRKNFLFFLFKENRRNMMAKEDLDLGNDVGQSNSVSRYFCSTFLI